MSPWAKLPGDESRLGAGNPMVDGESYQRRAIRLIDEIDKNDLDRVERGEEAKTREI